MKTRSRDSPGTMMPEETETTEMEEPLMYEIKKDLARINGKVVETFQRQIVQGENILVVTAGTTGYKKDASRQGGSRTYIGFDCFGGDFHFIPIPDRNGGQRVNHKGLRHPAQIIPVFDK